jgi:hypothetical protein
VRNEPPEQPNPGSSDGTPPTPALAAHFWHSVEATLFRDGISAVEHMTAYAVSSG